MNNLFTKIVNNPNALSKFIIEGQQKACVYPEPYQGKADAVYWLYSCNNHCQVFFAVSKAASDGIEENGLDDHDLCLFVESEVMNYCRDNTDYETCHRKGIDYSEKAFVRDEKGRFTGDYDMGCCGCECCCEPFDSSGYRWGLADESEFVL